MAKRTYSGQLNMYDFFKEPDRNEDGSVKDVEMVSFAPQFREDGENSLDELGLDSKTLEIARDAADIKAITEESIERKKKQEEYDKNASDILKKADQVISDISVKSRQTDEEIWIENQLAIKRKHKPKAKEIDEQAEFSQESLFEMTKEDIPKKNETIEAVNSEKKKDSVKLKENKEGLSTVSKRLQKKVQARIHGQITEAGLLDNPGMAVMERCFINKEGKKLVIAYLNYNKVYQLIPGNEAVTYIFDGSGDAVSYYVDMMHQYQDDKDWKETEEKPDIGPSKLMQIEN